MVLHEILHDAKCWYRVVFLLFLQDQREMAEAEALRLLELAGELAEEL